MSNPPFAGAGPSAGTSTRNRILRAANDLFARQGFSRVSMRMVAIAAGVTKPALYYYFRDKESLFEECLAEFNEQMEATMRAATAREGDTAVIIRAVAEALLTGSPFHPVRVHDELAEHVSGGLRRRLRGTFQSVVIEPLTEMFADLAERGQLRDGVSPSAAAAMLVGVCMAFLRPADGSDWSAVPLSGEDAAPHRIAYAVTELVLRGIAV